MTRKILGLTGPTGAGKSTVAAVLEEEGCRILDCDQLAHGILNQEACLSQLMEAFGSEIAPNGVLNRKLLAERAFQGKEHTARLNAITHPAIRREIQRQIHILQEQGAQILVIDAALLFEGQVDRLCDASIAVVAPEEIRLCRIMKRDQITKEQALARMAAQKTNDFYQSKADYCLDGGKTMEQVSRSARTLLAQLQEKGE